MSTSGIKYVEYTGFPNCQVIFLKSQTNLYCKGKLIAEYNKLNKTLKRLDPNGDHISVISHFKKYCER